MNNKFLLCLLFVIFSATTKGQEFTLSDFKSGSVECVEREGIRYRLHYSTGNVSVQPGYAEVVKNSGYVGEIRLKDTIQVTYYDNMWGTGFTTIVWDVVKLSKDAFSGNSGVTSLYISKNIKEINPESFLGCPNLKSITVDENNSVFDSRDNCNAVIETSSNTLVLVLKNSTIPNNIEGLGPCVYKNRIDLEDFIVKDGIKHIGPFAFEGCSNLKTFTLPESVSLIDGGVFKDCKNMKDLYCYCLPPIVTQFVTIDGSSLIVPPFEDIVDNTTLHAKYSYVNAYYEDSDYKDFKEVVAIEGSRMSYKLTYTVDGNEYKTEEVLEGEDIIPEEKPVRKGMTFSGWSEIPETMPVHDVEVTGTFSWSKKTIDNVIYEVSDTTNNYCKAIGNESASGAIKIAEAIDFDFSYNVTTITDNIFNGCKDITSIEIPATVTTIGERAFASIDKLTYVTIYAEEVPETDRTAFENSYIEDYVTLHVPAASIDKYKEVAPWKNFKSIVAIDGTKEGDDVVNPEEGDTDETNVGEEVIPVSGAKQTTWCSAYDLDFTGVEGVKAYIASGYDRETGIIWLTRVNKVPAGEGILIIAEKGDYTIPHVSTSAYYANLMVGTLKAMVLNETDGEYTNYYLSNGTSGVGFYKVNGSVDIKANRAYLPLLKGTTKANTRFIGIGFEDEDGTTGIRNISSEDNAVWYNLQGQRVDNPGKGIYIRNGKKVIVR